MFNDLKVLTSVYGKTELLNTTLYEKVIQLPKFQQTTDKSFLEVRVSQIVIVQTISDSVVYKVYFT